MPRASKRIYEFPKNDAFENTVCKNKIGEMIDPMWPGPKINILLISILFDWLGQYMFFFSKSK